MRVFKGMVIITALLPLAAGLGGCASNLIEVRKGSDRVLLTGESQIVNCQPKGEINVSVLAEVGFITRSSEAVEANLAQLARNGAVDAGADTVVKGNSSEYGKRTFTMYKCQP